MKQWASIAFLAWVSGTTLAQQATLTADTDSLRMGEPVHLALRVIHSIETDSLTVNWPDWPEELAPNIEVLMVDTQRTSVPDPTDPFTFCHEQVMVITVWDTGYFALPPLDIPTTIGPIQTNALLLYSAGPEVDHTSMHRDVKDPVHIVYTSADWLRDNWWYLLLGLLVVCGGVWAYLRAQKKPQDVAVTPEAPPEALPHIRAFQQLDALQQAQLWQAGKIKPYHTALSDIFRTYLEGRYQVQAHEATTDEILDALRGRGLPQHLLDELTPSLRMGDLVKFAKHKPSPTDHQMAWEALHRFVDRTRPQTLDS